MTSIGTTHVSGWRGFNYGKNDGSLVEHELDGEDEQPTFIASARDFVCGHGASYARPKINAEDE